MRKTFISLILMTIAVTSTAQTVGDAFYIYRNDGSFNAFFREEVDSIVYSNYDNDSIWYDDVVTQVVYTTDSIYRIPLAAIDSVGFVQPETILQPNVRRMEEEGLMDYLLSVDGMTLFFKTSIPHDLRPVVGDVLLKTSFDNPILSDGFAGKVLTTQMTDDAFTVGCDSIYDLFEVFEQLVSIERLTDESRSKASRRAGGDWVSGQNTLAFNLGYSHKLSDSESVSLSGSVDGSYVATVIYNITRKEQYFNLRIDHDWQYGAHVNFKKELGSFGTLKGPVVSLPAIRFPAVAPVFKFQVAGAPFVKGEGNIELDFSLSSPVHSYVAQAIYNNGHFSGWNHKKPVQGNNSPSFETAFSLNGSVQVGIMLDLWLGLDVSIKGFAKDLLKLGTGLDFYIGPKLSGDFSMKGGKENPLSYYSIYKDSKIGIDWLHVDYEFFGEASLAGHKFPRATFCDGSLDSPLKHDWYILPEFTELSVLKDAENKKATISTTPSRDILFPLEVGMGLYNKGGDLLSTKYEARKYKRENEGFEVQQTFSSLDTDKEYTAMPFIKFLGGEVPALPEEDFTIGTTSCPDGNHPHMIDLGLPSGTKWACCNVEATTPEGYGGYYAWGETEEKDYYSWDTYQYWTDSDGDGGYNYDNEMTNIGSDIAGTGYDVAHVRWGGSWVMPSLDQIEELLNNCSTQWTTQNGVNGRTFTGPSGGTIFLPAAGYRWDGDLYLAGSYGDSWSSTQEPSYPGTACNLGFYSGGADLYFDDRDRGRTVRPVSR